MKQLFLVRHGVTTFNEQGRYCGVSDAPLSSEGLRQVRCVADLLRQEQFISIYTSPLKRCVQSAEIISKPYDVCPASLPGFSEIDFGLWEGLSFEAIQAGYPEELSRWFERPETFTFPEGESIAGFHDRVIGSLGKVLEGQGDRLIVAHGGSIRIAICHLCGWGMKGLHSFELEPASLTILEHYEDSSVVRVLNETCHLKDGGAV